MGLTQKLGTIPLAIQTDSSNNVGIGGAANASYKLAVTGASLFSSSIYVGANISQLLPITTTNFQILTGCYYDGSNIIATATSGNRIINNSGNFQFNTFTGATIGGSVTDTERMRITSSGNVGIGTSSPTVISGFTSVCVNNATTGGFFEAQQGGTVLTRFGGQSDIAFIDTVANIPFIIKTNSTERMRITSGGNVLIGTTSGSNKFSVSVGGVVSDFYVNSSGGVGSYGFGTGAIYSNAGILTNTNPSDSRLKENIEDIQWGINDILKLRPVKYNWKEDKINQGVQFGFIAQEVQEVMPEAIKEFGEDVKYLGLEKDAIYATLVKAIQELSAKVTALENK